MSIIANSVTGIDALLITRDTCSTSKVLLDRSVGTINPDDISKADY